MQLGQDPHLAVLGVDRLETFDQVSFFQISKNFIELVGLEPAFVFELDRPSPLGLFIIYKLVHYLLFISKIFQFLEGFGVLISQMNLIIALIDGQQVLAEQLLQERLELGGVEVELGLKFL